MLSSEQLRVVGPVGQPEAVIQLLMEEVTKLDPDTVDDFEECYPGLSLAGDEWLDFCNQDCAWELMDELIEWLEDNSPEGWNFGQMGNNWVFLKEDA